MNPDYIVDKEKQTVVCLLKSKGELFRGIAKCHKEEFNEDLGKKLALCRAEMQVRERDLIEIRYVVDCLKGTIDSLPKHQSKLWMIFLQDACRVEKIQLAHMRNLKDQIKNLRNGIIL